MTHAGGGDAAAPTRGRRIGFVVLMVLGLTNLTGCLRVIAHDIDYYEDGPYQLEGPQGVFPRGTHVWVLGKEGSYARVLTLDGRAGYVWDQALVSLEEWLNRPDDPEPSDENIRPGPPGPLGAP